MATVILITWSMTLCAQEQALPDMSHIFSLLRENRIAYNKYTDSIFKIDNHNEWIEFFRRRAVKNNAIFEENKRMLHAIDQYFAQPEEKIMTVAYDSLFYAFKHYVGASYSDPFLTEHILNILQKHFEQLPDSLNPSMRTNLWLGYSYYSIFSLGKDTTMLRKAYQLFKNVANTPNRQNFADHTVPYFYALYDLLLPTWYLHHFCTKEELYGYANRLKDLLDSPEMVPYHAQAKKGKSRLAALEENFLRNIYFVDSTFFDKAYADSLLRVVINKNRQDPKLSLVSFYRTLIMQTKVGEITHTQAYKIAHKRYERERAKLKNMQFTRETIITFIQQFMNLIYLNDTSGLSYSTRRQRTIRYCKDIVTAYSKLLHQEEDVSYVRDLNTLVTYNRILKYLTEKERIAFLNALMVNVQTSTYAHSVHVSEMAEIVMQGVLDYNPELLVGTLGYKSVQQVKRHRKKYMEFIRNAAQYHDLGKNQIPTVVTNSYRPLTDQEFNIIKKHPAFGLIYLNLAPSLNIYHDTTLGHHKWYNGKGGYPADFDNTKSPLRIMIDIVTISDCMQAATEKLGRNYKHEISFTDVMQELREDAGTRYNPDLVSLIDNHIDVADKLSASIMTGWFDIYYNIYSQYFDK